MEVPKNGKFVGNSIGDLRFYSDDALFHKPENSGVTMNSTKPKHTENIIVLGMCKMQKFKKRTGNGIEASK